MNKLIALLIFLFAFGTCIAQSTGVNPGAIPTNQPEIIATLKPLQNSIWKAANSTESNAIFFSIDSLYRMDVLTINKKDTFRFPLYNIDYTTSSAKNIVFKTYVERQGTNYVCLAKLKVRSGNKVELKLAYDFSSTGGPANNGGSYSHPVSYIQISCCTNHVPHHCCKGMSEMLSYSRTKSCTF